MGRTSAAGSVSLNLARPRIGPHDGDRVLRHLVEVHGVRFQFVLLEQPAHAANDLAGSYVVLADVADDVGHLTERGRQGIGSEKARQQVAPI
jgi:hypothetical protein